MLNAAVVGAAVVVAVAAAAAAEGGTWTGHRRLQPAWFDHLHGGPFAHGSCMEALLPSSFAVAAESGSG